MLESLYKVSATLALGGFFLFGLLVIVEIGKQDVFKRFLDRYHIPRSLAASLLFSMTFIAGVFLEDLSDHVAESFKFLFQPLGTEQRIRTQALLDTPGLDTGLREQRAYRRYAYRALTPEQITRLEKHLEDNPHRGLVDCFELAPNGIEKLAVNLFFVAKNRVYKESTYFAELSEVERQIRFLRGVALACFLLLLALLGVGLFRAVASRQKLLSITIPTALLLLALYLCARYTYTQEEESFTKKVFGYYLVTQEMKKPMTAPKTYEASMPLSSSDGGRQQLHPAKSKKASAR